MSILTAVVRRARADVAAARRAGTAPLEGRIVPGRPTDRSPVPLSSRRSNVQLFAPPQRAGSTSAALGSMEQAGIVYAITTKLATSVAAAEWRLYRKARSGRPEDRREVTDHPALFVLNRPNPFMTRQELFEIGQQHGELVGETWWIIARNGGGTGAPVEIWPVRPDTMTVEPHPTAYISGYSYRSPDGERTALKTTDVVFIRCPNPSDPYRGLGPVQAVISDISNSQAAAEWNRMFFVNGALPGGLIELEGSEASDVTLDELADRWREQHQGMRNSHRVGILTAGHFKEIGSASHRDMQFHELATLADERIRLTFGIPKPILGTVDDVNRATAEAMDGVFARHCLVPRLERIKGALNADFLPMFEGTEGLEFDYCSPVPADREAERADLDSKVKNAVALIGAGADPATTCELLGLPAFTFGKPVAASPAEQIAAALRNALDSNHPW